MSERELWKCLTCDVVTPTREEHAPAHDAHRHVFDAMPLPDETDSE